MPIANPLAMTPHKQLPMLRTEKNEMLSVSRRLQGTEKTSSCCQGPNSMLFKPLSARAVFQRSIAGTSTNKKFLHGPVMPPPPKLANLHQSMAPSKKGEPIKAATKRKHPSPTPPPPPVSLSTTTCGSRLYEPFHNNNNKKARASERPKPAVEMMRPDEKQFLEAAVTLSSISRQGSNNMTASSSTSGDGVPRTTMPPIAACGTIRTSELPNALLADKKPIRLSIHPVSRLSTIVKKASKPTHA